MSTNNPFPSAAPDFSDPLGLLRACHERIFQHCDTAEKLGPYLAEKGLDQTFREAAAQLHRYFSSAAVHHHEDEEQDLFPRLLSHSPALAATIERLEREHAELAELWQQLAPWLSEPATISDTRAFAALTRRFAAAYRDHATQENGEILAIAPELLSREELRQLGHSMAARRGVSPPPGD